MKAPVQRLSNRAGPMAAMLVNLLHGTLAGCATQLAVLPLEMVVTRIHASALEWPPQHEKNGILGPENQPEQGSLETTPGERTEAARSDASAAAHSPRISSPSSVSQSPSSASALDGLSSSSNSSSGKYRYESSRDRDTNQSSSGSNHKESTASAVASAIRAIYAEGGVGNFWTSLVPALLICVNPGLTQLLQLQLRNGRMPENLSLAESAWHGALSKLIAMAVTYPLSTVKTVMQSAPATQGHNWHPAGVGEGAARQANGSHEAARKVPGDEAVPATTVTLPATDDPASPPPQAPEMNQFAAFVACIASIVNTRGVAGLYRGIGCVSDISPFMQQVPSMNTKRLCVPSQQLLTSARSILLVIGCAFRPSLFKKGLGEAILSVVRDKTGWLLLFCLANFQMRQKQQKLRASSGVSSSASS